MLQAIENTVIKGTKELHTVVNRTAVDAFSIKAKRQTSCRLRIMLPELDSFSESEGCWKMVCHIREGWGETGYMFLAPSAKLHLPMLPWTSF